MIHARPIGVDANKMKLAKVIHVDLLAIMSFGAGTFADESDAVWGGLNFGALSPSRGVAIVAASEFVGLRSDITPWIFYDFRLEGGGGGGDNNDDQAEK